MITTIEFVKAWLEIADTTYDTKINILIPVVEDEYLKIRNLAWELNDLEEIIYPTNGGVVATEMIAYKINSSNLKAIGSIKSSESIDAYSVSWRDSKLVDGYPDTITSQIERFHGCK